MAKSDAAKYTGPTCCACRREIGVAAKVTPFSVNDGEGGPYESFCPTCFVFARAPLEPHRFHQGAFVPVKCGACGVESVAIGQDACGQCGSRTVVVLPRPLVA